MMIANSDVEMVHEEEDTNQYLKNWLVSCSKKESKNILGNFCPQLHINYNYCYKSNIHLFCSIPNCKLSWSEFNINSQFYVVSQFSNNDSKVY